MGEILHCPFCHNDDSRVIDSRTADDGNAIRRRRECTSCNKRFTTIESAALAVRKRSGILEPFSREKVVSGVKKACQGSPVSHDDLAKLAQQVEEDLRATGKSQIDSQSIGRAILRPLRELDVVAYYVSPRCIPHSTIWMTFRLPLMKSVLSRMKLVQR